MADKKEKDVLTNVETEEIIVEEVVVEEVDGEEVVVEEVIVEEMIDVVDAAETADTVEVPEPVEMISETEKPKKKGRIRGFFKGKKLAIGIIVLAVLLVANVSVFGMNKHMNKGHRAHSGKTVEREYTQGPSKEYGKKGVECKKDGGKEQRAEVKPNKEGKAGAEGTGEARGSKGDKKAKAESVKEVIENVITEIDAEEDLESGAAA